MKALCGLGFSEYASDNHNDSEVNDASDVGSFEDYYSRDQEDVGSITALLDEVEQLKLQVRINLQDQKELL